jgi:integrase
MASVYKRTWRGQDGKERVRWVSAYKDQHGRRHNKGFKARKDAKAFLTLTEGEVIRGIHTPEHASITVAEAAALWLKRAELEQLERSTIAAYTGHVTFHIAPLIGSVKLAKLSTPVVQLFRDKLLETRSRALAKKVLASLKSIIGEAMRRGLVAQNTATGVVIDSKRRTEGKLAVGVDVPTKAEIGMLIEAAQGRWRPLFVTLVFTGMRASELRGLAWDAVDLDARVIHVRQRANLWGEIGSPKSAAGRRSIPMAPMVVNALREWRLICPRGQRNLVFPTSTGSVQTHGNIVARGWEPLQRALGLVDERSRPRYRLHSLRHIFASFCIDQGFNVKRLQTMLGHSSSQMTLDVYGHWIPNAEDDQARLARAEAAIFAVARSVESAA